MDKAQLSLHVLVVTKGILPLEYNKNHITWHEVLFS